MNSTQTRAKPVLTFWQIWNMCFGFLGIQFGFALQNANVSRIFQTLGAEIDDLPILWIAAPLTGLLVQPIVGYFSDRTWTRLGRRRPYFLIGAILTSAALIIMPNSPTLWIAAGVLWMLDASINISMEPFRAFVGDQLGPRQRPRGYAMQSFFIGLGAVVASALPWLLTRYGFSNTADAGAIPETVRYSFYFGAVVLLAAVGWTVLRTREYPPEQLASFDDAEPASSTRVPSLPSVGLGVALLVVGLGLAAAVWLWAWGQTLYILAGGAGVLGIAMLVLSGSKGSAQASAEAKPFIQIMSDLYNMPNTMARLAVVQFFSWFALFAMWIYTTGAVTSVHYGSSDPASAAYNEGANWVGMLFAGYNGFAALAALVIPRMTVWFGLRQTHLINLWIGGAALISFLLIKDPRWLMLSMVGIGFAWASILSLPYALLCDSLPARKMGVYMGIFNFFIVLPQLVAAILLGLLLKTFFGNQPIYALVIGGVSFAVAGLCVLWVAEPGGRSDSGSATES